MIIVCPLVFLFCFVVKMKKDTIYIELKDGLC